MTARATSWSITINNPTEEDVLCAVSGWKLEGQYEVGAEGTRHYQGLLKTPQVRFSAVKKAFPRAHIEVARNVAALQKYVHKDDTRVGFAETQINMFTAQKLIADAWDNEEWTEFHTDMNRARRHDSIGSMALEYVDQLVEEKIAAGYRCLEFIAINPMWRSSWKKFYAAIITRHAIPPPPPPAPCPSEAQSEGPQVEEVE